MKKLMMMALFAGVVAFVATGCTTITTSDGAERMDLPESVSTDYRANFEHKNVRVKGSGNVNVLFGIFAWGSEGFAENSDLSYFSFFPSPANYAKSSAVYNACQTNGARAVTDAEILSGERAFLSVQRSDSQPVIIL